MKARSASALTFIFITLLIDTIGIGIIMPVVPKLIENLIHVQDEAIVARYNGWLIFAYAFMQFIFSPILGGLSDRYGRRPVLLIALFGMGVDYLLQAAAPTISWLFLGRALAGMCGASFTTASAYIADVSVPEKRAQNFGMIGVAFGLGFIIGPLLGGIFGKLGAHVPFIVAAVFSFLNLLLGYFVLPESLPRRSRRRFEWKRSNPFSSLIRLSKYTVISGLLGSFILIYLAAHAVQSTWALYTMKKFNWDELMVGISLGVVGVMIMFVQGFLIRLVIPRFGDTRSVFIGLVFYTAGLVLFSFASQGWMMYACIVPYCLGGIAGPALQSIISSQVTPGEQGELQGGLTSIMSVTSIIGPLMMNYLFSYFSGAEAPVYFPSMPYLAGAVFMGAAALLAIPTLNKIKSSRTPAISNSGYDIFEEEKK